MSCVWGMAFLCGSSLVKESLLQAGTVTMSTQMFKSDVIPQRTKKSMQCHNINKPYLFDQCVQCVRCRFIINTVMRIHGFAKQMFFLAIHCLSSVLICYRCGSGRCFSAEQNDQVQISHNQSRPWSDAERPKLTTLFSQIFWSIKSVSIRLYFIFLVTCNE